MHILCCESCVARLEGLALEMAAIKTLSTQQAAVAIGEAGKNLRITSYAGLICPPIQPRVSIHGHSFRD
jgi:hypothetical protein